MLHGQRLYKRNLSLYKVNIWSSIKKRKLMTWRQNDGESEKVKVLVQDKVVELQEDRFLFTRMKGGIRSRPDTAVK